MSFFEKPVDEEESFETLDESFEIETHDESFEPNKCNTKEDFKVKNVIIAMKSFQEQLI